MSSPVNTGIGDLWQVYQPGIYPGHSGPPSLAIPPWVCPLSTGDGFGHFWVKQRILHSSRPCNQDRWHTGLLYASLTGFNPHWLKGQKGWTRSWQTSQFMCKWSSFVNCNELCHYYCRVIDRLCSTMPEQQSPYLQKLGNSHVVPMNNSSRRHCRPMSASSVNRPTSAGVGGANGGVVGSGDNLMIFDTFFGHEDVEEPTVLHDRQMQKRPTSAPVYKRSVFRCSIYNTMGKGNDEFVCNGHLFGKKCFAKFILVATLVFTHLLWINVCAAVEYICLSVCLFYLCFVLCWCGNIKIIYFWAISVLILTPWPLARHQLKLQDCELEAVHCMVCLCTSQLTLLPNYPAWWQRHFYVRICCEPYLTEQWVELNQWTIDRVSCALSHCVIKLLLFIVIHVIKPHVNSKK